MSETRYAKVIEPEPALLCKWCSRRLAVVGRRWASVTVNGLPDYIYVHVIDGSSECVRTLIDPVRPYDCWIGDERIASIEHQLYGDDEPDDDDV